jgi:hypothetical protein
MALKEGLSSRRRQNGHASAKDRQVEARWCLPACVELPPTSSRIPPGFQSATIAAGGRIGEIVREEECAAHGGIGEGDPIVIEVTSQLGIKD